MISISKIWNLLTSILLNRNNFHPLEVVNRVSETQLQVGKISHWIILRLKDKNVKTLCTIHEPCLVHCRFDNKYMFLWLQLVALLPRIFILPFMALLYLFAPSSRHIRSWRSPVNKFFSLTASYIAFLILLFIQNSIDNLTSMRGPPTTGVNCIV